MATRPGRGNILVLFLALALGTALGVGWLFDWFQSPDLVTPQGLPKDKKKGKEEENLTLDEEQRKYIWQVEHETLVLNKHWFKEWAVALSKGDESALRGMLAEGFKGGLLNNPAEEKV